MGADSSTLQSVESLNSSLQNLEQRMFEIENFHLHHERNTTLEHQLLVCGKSIRCNPHVNVVVGPVMGLVTASTVRFLIEVDVDTELECHLFKQAETYTQNRFYKSFTFHVLARQPSGLLLEGLESDTLYAAYFGGIKQEYIVSNVAQFFTSSSANDTRYFVSSNVLVDSNTPGEKCLLEDISSTIKYSCQLEQVRNQTYYYANIGGFLNIEEVVRKRAYELICLIQNEQFRNETWNRAILSFEREIKDKYIAAFRDPVFASLARKCSILLFPGEEETAAEILQSLMKEDEESAVDDSSSVQASVSASLKSKMSRGKSTVANDKSVFSKNTREDRAKIDSVVTLTKEESKELKVLAVSLVARVLRKLNNDYYRQLWDDQFSPHDADQKELECLLRSILTTKRYIAFNRSLKMSLDVELSRVPKSSTYVTQVQAQIGHFNSKIESLKQELSEVVIKSSDIKTKSQPLKANNLITLSERILCFIDFSWSWIGHNGLVKFPLPLQVELDQQIMADLDDLLAKSNSLRSAIILFCTPFLSSNVSEAFRCSVGDTTRVFNSLNTWQAGDIDRAVAVVGKSSNSHQAQVGHLQPPNLQNLDLVRSGIKTCFLHPLQQPMMPYLLRSLKKVIHDNSTPTSIQSPGFHFDSSVSFLSSCYSTLAFESHDKFPPSYSEFVVYLEGKDQLNARPTFGVVCGYVSATSATLLLESHQSGYIELTCFDGLTSREHSLCKFVKAGVPSEFQFFNLAPFRNYDVLLNKTTSSLSVKQSMDIQCNFTTLKRFASLRLTGEGIMQDLRSVNVESSLVQSVASDAKSPQDIAYMENGGIRILVASSIGSCDYQMKNNEVTKSSPIQRVVSHPWNGVDLTIHGPCSIHWRPAVLAAFSYLARVESGDCDHEDMEINVTNILQDAIRKSFSDDIAFQSGLRSCANYFTSSPIADLAIALNTFAIENIIQDSSKFAVDVILSTVAKLQNEYFGRLWAYDVNDDFFALSYLEEASTIIFEIKPSYSHTEGFHISSKHIAAIRSILNRDILKDHYTRLLLVSPFPLITFDTTNQKYNFIQSSRSFYSCNVTQSLVLLGVCCDWLKFNEKRELTIICWSNCNGLVSKVVGESKHRVDGPRDFNHNSASVNEGSFFGVGEEVISQQSPMETKNNHASPSFTQLCVAMGNIATEPISFPSQGKLYSVDGSYHFKFHHDFDNSKQWSPNIISIPWNADAKKVASQFTEGNDDYWMDHANDLESNALINQLSEYPSYEAMMEQFIGYISEDILKANTSIDFTQDVQSAASKLLQNEEKTIESCCQKLATESIDYTMSVKPLVDIHNLFVDLYFRFSPRTREVICLPSRFAIFSTLQKCLVLESPDQCSRMQKVVTRLAIDSDFFKVFCKHVFSMQLILEQLSLKFGLLD